MHYLQKTGKQVFLSLQRYFLLIVLGVLYPCVSVFAQNTPENATPITVNATVYDDKGEPIIGANVIEKGTGNGYGYSERLQTFGICRKLYQR